MMRLSQEWARRVMPTVRQRLVPPVTIPFRGWYPDQPEFNNPGVTRAENVLPNESGGFRFLPSLVERSSALTARCRGAAAARNTSGVVKLYAGTASGVFSFNADQSWTDVSVGGGYSTSDDDNWEFAQFGNTLLATNYDDPVQGITIGGANFANHLTSTLTPRAKHIATVGDFVVLGYTNDTTDGVVPHRVWWSAINDSQDFDPSASTQCDYQDVQEGGPVSRIVPTRAGALVFLEEGVQRMTYLGPPIIFGFTKIEAARGTQIPGSVIPYGGEVFYIGPNGFHRLVGDVAEPIGEGKVDREFLDNFSLSNAHRVSSAIDTKNNIVMWSFPYGTGGTPNRIFFYHTGTKEWAYSVWGVDAITRSMSVGYTLDDLDSIGTNIDDTAVFGESWDTAGYEGGGVVRLGVFGTDDNKLKYFSGSSGSSQHIETGNFEPVIGGYSEISRVDLVGDPREIRLRMRQGNYTHGGLPLYDGDYYFDFTDRTLTYKQRSKYGATRFHKLMCSIGADPFENFWGLRVYAVNHGQE